MEIRFQWPATGLRTSRASRHPHRGTPSSSSTTVALPPKENNKRKKRKTRERERERVFDYPAIPQTRLVFSFHEPVNEMNANKKDPSSRWKSLYRSESRFARTGPRTISGGSEQMSLYPHFGRERRNPVKMDLFHLGKYRLLLQHGEPET